MWKMVRVYTGRTKVKEKENDKDNASATNIKAVGIDLGVAQTITLSNGEVLQGAKSFKKHNHKLANEQRKLAKKVKFYRIGKNKNLK